MECVAYTRFVLDRGLTGDRLDLEAALAPCIVGYAEAVALLADDPATIHAGNPYAAWMEAYAGDDYRAAVTSAIARLERIGAARGADARYESQFIQKVSFVPIPSLWGHPAGAGGNPADRAFLNENMSKTLNSDWLA